MVRGAGVQGCRGAGTSPGCAQIGSLWRCAMVAKPYLGIGEVLAACAEKGGDLGADEGQVTKLRAVREVEEVESRAIDGSGGEANAIVEVEGAQARADNVRRAEQLAVGQVEELEHLGLAAVWRSGGGGGERRG